MENVNALKALYVALGGSADTVAALTLNAEVINAIATLVDTTGGVLPAYTVSDKAKVLKVDTEGSGASEKAKLVWGTDAT